MGDWCTIESDPGVFTELIRKIGVRGAEVTEIYSLDMLSQHFPIHGLIFLFKWEPKPAKQTEQYYDPELFFAHQVIQNACATQAILSIILNSSLKLDEDLLKFKEFAMSLPPSDRGLVLSNSDLIRTTHNSFAQQEPFEFVQSKKDKKGEAYHFVSFIHFKGKIFELDGLQKGPIFHAECEENEWINRVSPIIQARMEEFSGTEIRFNLLAVVNNNRDTLKQRFKELKMRVVAVKTKLISLDVPVEGDEMECEFDEAFFEGLSDDVDVLKTELAVNDEELGKVKEDLDQENRKYDKWRVENERRKHNYVPFILKLLEKIADQGKLVEYMEKAKEAKGKGK